MENGEQEATTAEQVIISENKQKDHVYEQQISGASETQDSITKESEKSTPVSANDEEPSVLPKEPAAESPIENGREGEEPAVAAGESVDGDKERKYEAQQSEDPDNEVLPGNLRDYKEYQHDTPEEIRKQQLRELAPEHTANIPGVHHHHEYKKMQPESFLWLSFFTLIFFSRIFGVFALYKSIKVRLLYLEGDYEGSEDASKWAKKLNVIGMIFCLCWVSFVLIILKGVGLFDMDDG